MESQACDFRFSILSENICLRPISTFGAKMHNGEIKLVAMEGVQETSLF